MNKVKFYIGKHIKSGKFHKKKHGAVDNIEEATLFRKIRNLKSSIRALYPTYGYSWINKVELGSFEFFVFEVDLERPGEKIAWPE